MSDEQAKLDRGDVLPQEMVKEAQETPPPAPEPVEDELEGEETAEERAAREAAEAEAERKKRIRVPKARLDEVIERGKQREEQLQARIAALEAEKAPPQTDTRVQQAEKRLEDLQEQYEDALIDGQKDKAKQFRKEMDQLRNALFDFKAAQQTETARRAAADELRYDLALQKIENQYPVLNPEAEEFDQSVADEVIELIEAFTARGYNRHAALVKAANYVMAPRASVQPDTRATLRSIDARKRAADANKRQPAGLPVGLGKDHDKDGKPATQGIDVMKLSQARFAEIDQATLARLRGDEI